MDFGLQNVQSSFFLLSELQSWNVTSFFVSPGSRSTPLVLALSQLKNIASYVILDERSAGFGALGSAKSNNHIPALLCTSGTAVANYLPAVIESSQSRIPFVLLTADRPEELVGTGAPQTIVQNNIFGDYVCSCIDFEPAKYSQEELREIISKGLSLMHETGKPVHFNLQFRKPLQPSVPLSQALDIAYLESKNPKNGAHNPSEVISINLPAYQRPILIAGEIPFHASKLWINSDAVNGVIPTFVEPSSNLPQLWNFWETGIAEQLMASGEDPDVIIRLGRMPVNRHLYRLLEKFKDIPTVQISFDGFFDNPIFVETKERYVVRSKYEINLPKTKFDSSWISKWLNQTKKIELSEPEFLTDGQVHRILAPILHETNVLYSNSFPVRDAQSFGFPKTSKIHVNRGASGIDGIISTAAGIGLGSAESTALFIGDLAFQHDTNGLAFQSHLKNSGISLSIFVINNGGGGIFDMLPIGNFGDVFETYFFTPQKIEIERLCDAHDIPYFRCQTKQDLTHNYSANRLSGISVYECVTDHKISMTERRIIWKEN